MSIVGLLDKLITIFDCYDLIIKFDCSYLLQKFPILLANLVAHTNLIGANGFIGDFVDRCDVLVLTFPFSCSKSEIKVFGVLLCILLSILTFNCSQFHESMINNIIDQCFDLLEKVYQKLLFLCSLITKKMYFLLILLH